MATQIKPAINVSEYKNHLKVRAIRDFLIRCVFHARNKHSHFIGRNINMLLLELNDIDGADLDRPDEDEVGLHGRPF